ncbi:trypsin-like serine protease [Catellatospora sichuanensis]|uniref:trypsin-like serine protease n=1 Tax=Catellatospora sichuanensis TaxID=1969805 RepID=UPI001642C292|nr:trypsin-like serine protease [Catellatospora sichuanensis]
MAVSSWMAGGAVPAGAVPVGLPSLVDDGVYPYPDAAQILAEQNVRLISGDGHIVLADCATPPVGNIGLLKVWTTDELIGPDGVGRVCFKVNAPSGVLNLEVPGVYEIRGDGQTTGTGHEVTAELEDETGEEITVEIDPDGSTPVGLGADPTAPPTMLLQLRAGDGPAPVTGTQAAVGKLTGHDRMCTTTLVAPRWVLAAASCLAADPNQPQVTEGVSNGAYQVTFPGHAPVAVDWLIPRTGRDVVLARLATPVQDITPVALATTAPTGVALTATGYGRNTDWITDQQQTAQITFTNTTATTLSAASGPLVCSGMAGAPVLTDGKLAAILTQAGQQGCLGSTTTDTSVTATRTDDLTTWFNAITTTTAAHTWTLADMPATATPGTPVTTTTDTVFTGTALPLTATAGTTWNTGDQFSPNIALNGTTGTLTTGAPAVNTNADFTISVRVKPTVAGGVVVSQNGTQTAAFKLYSDAATKSWRFAMSSADSTTATWATAAAPANSVQLGQWAHLNIAFRASSGLMTLDVDGVNRASIHNPARWAATGGLRLGAVKTGASTVGSWYAGQLALVQTWNAANTAFRTYPTAGSTLINRNGNAEVYFNSGGTLKETHFNGTSWSVPQSLGSTVQGIPTVVQNPVNNNIQVYHVSGGLLSETSFDGTTWTTTSFGVAATGQPAVLVNPNTDNVEIYFNSGNVLKERHWSPSGGWSAVQSLGASITGSPTVIYNPVNRNVEVYLNSGGSLSEKYFTGGAWSSLKNLGVPMTGQPSALYNPNNNNIQVYANSGGLLKELYWNAAAGWSTLGNLALAMTGSPAAVYNPVNGNTQVYVNSGGALKEKYWRPSVGWANPGDLTTPITNSPWVTFNPGTGDMEIYLNSAGNLSLKSWDFVTIWAPVQNLGAPITN